MGMVAEMMEVAGEPNSSKWTSVIVTAMMSVGKVGGGRGMHILCGGNGSGGRYGGDVREVVAAVW